MSIPYIEDCELYDNLHDAKQEALDWSCELSGEHVVVYESTGTDKYKPILEIFA